MTRVPDILGIGHAEVVTAYSGSPAVSVTIDLLLSPLEVGRDRKNGLAIVADFFICYTDNKGGSARFSRIPSFDHRVFYGYRTGFLLPTF